MRLTLRTLLAYMDDILEPSDHEELSQKIEASEFASELIHRTRDTVRRLRLGAPSVLAANDGDLHGAENMSDANAVAEYIDNTLPPEDVGDFERLCLEPGHEADMHLAEVASCHHVLTMVLGEPAEVDSSVKHRLYSLASDEVSPQAASPTVLPPATENGIKLRVEPAHTRPVEPLPTDAPPAATVPVEHKTKLPDYLQAVHSQRRTRRWLAFAATVVVVAVAGVIVGDSMMKPELSAEQEEAASNLDEVLSGDLVTESEPNIDPAIGESMYVGRDIGDGMAPPFDAGMTGAVEPPVITVPNVSVPETTIANSSPPAEGDLQTLPSETMETTSDAAPPIQEPGPELIIETDSEQSARIDLEDPSVGGLSDVAADILGEGPETPAAADAGAATAGTPENPLARDLEAELSPPAPPEPAGPIQLGNYLGNNDVLLRYDSAVEGWVRLPPRSGIFAGDHLLSLPKFRTHVVLNNLNVYLAGGTKLELPVADETADPAETALDLSLVYGRLMLNAGLDGSIVRMHVGDETRLVRLGSSAGLAVEVHRVIVPGADYEILSAPVQTVWYVTSGSVAWREGSSDAKDISAQMTWKTIDGKDETVEAADELPSWLDGEQLTTIDRSAAGVLAEQLTAGQPVGLKLLELNDRTGLGRRQEIRTLAAEASLLVGEFEPFVQSLSDSNQVRAWHAHIDQLRQSLALSPYLAGRLRDAFVNLRGEQAADDLMEMVRGYSLADVGRTREEVQDGALAKLIGWLEHESLDYRVLAIYNLNEITGTTNLEGYQPDGPPRRREVSVAKIWNRLESNELVSRP